MAYLKQALPYIQIVISLLLIGAILFQQRGTGLSAAFGGEGNVYRTKRGFEKLLLQGTIVLALLFILSAFVGLLI